MKKILSLALVMLLVLSVLAGCGAKKEDAPATTEPAQTSEQQTEAKPEAEAEQTAEPEAQPEAEPEAEAEQTAEPEAETEPEQTAEGAITVTDMTGREITLAEPATKVVALSAADCEVLFAIGAGDTLVGRGEYCDYPAEVLNVPSVQSGADTNIEQIIALEPQVLLMSAMAQTTEQVEALEKAGVKVVVSDAQDIEGTYTAIRMIGKLMGKEDNAEKVVSDMQAKFDELKAAVAELNVEKKPTVYFEVSPLEYGLWAAGGGSFMNEVAEMLGMENVFADQPAWAQISEEQVIERNPDFIVTITMYFGEGDTPEQEIASRPGWENVTAVKNNHIMRMENNELSRPTARIADGAQMLYDFVYVYGLRAGAADAA